MSIKCIYNGTILTMNDTRQIIENGVVIVDGSSIVAVGTEELMASYNIDEKIDANGGIIMPGFINGHNHVSMTVFRGLGEDMPDKLRRYLFPLEDLLVDGPLVYAGARLGIAEMIMGGVTTFTDMYYYEDQVARAAKEMGMRAIVGETILNRIAPDCNEPYEGLDHALALVKKWSGDDLITPAFAPHALYTNDTEHLKEIKRLADEHQVPILTHIAEMTYEVEEVQTKYNLSPVQYLDSIGFLGKNVIGAHFIYVDEKDMEILVEKQVGIVHNVAANAKSGRLVAPVQDMLKYDLRIGLGTDGPMSGNSLDIIGILDQYTKIHKVDQNNSGLATSLEAVELGTIRGAEAIHLDHEIGSLEIGKKADLIIVDTLSPNMQPIYDHYSSLVYTAYPHDVTMTMINGKMVMKDRKLLTSNMMDIINDVKSIQGKILEKSSQL